MKKRNKILSIILSGTFALAAIGLGVGIGLKKPAKDPTADVVIPKEDIVADNDGNKLNDGVFHKLPIAMLVSQTPAKTETSDDMKTSVNVVATITPDDAANKTVDWSVAFVNSSSAWANGKAATDYITAEPTTDGALTATVTCKAAFGEQIKITVTSRDNPEASASCTVDYKQQFEGYLFSASQTGKTPTLNNSTKKGKVYADFNNAEQLKVAYTYKKSSVYTVALNDSEIAVPTTMDVVIENTTLKTALNEAKSGSGDTLKVTAANKIFAMNLFNSKLAEGLTPAQSNTIISALTATANTSPVSFSIKDGTGKVLAKFEIEIDTSALSGQKKVEKIVLDQTELVFGGNY